MWKWNGVQPYIIDRTNGRRVNLTKNDVCLVLVCLDEPWPYTLLLTREGLVVFGRRIAFDKKHKAGFKLVLGTHVQHGDACEACV